MANNEETRALIVRFCTWCKAITLRAGYRDSDLVMILVQPKGKRMAWINGAEVLIQDGICEECSAKEFPAPEICACNGEYICVKHRKAIDESISSEVQP